MAAALPAADMRTGVYRGRVVTFENAGGLAIYQGDIILGNTADVEATPEQIEATGKQRESSVVVSTRSLWPGGVIPYSIDTTLSTGLQSRINDAIKHWNTNTSIRLSARTNETNYVRFTTSTSTVACSSSVGMIGGAQMVRLPDACSLGPIIHEIGHAVGLWHEQERADRNEFVTILYENIDKQLASNYDQVLANGRDFGPYDFGSIMHYGAFDFSKDGVAPAMETVPSGIPIGQRGGLSPSDIDTVQRLYEHVPSQVTVTTVPRGLKLIIDGALVDDGAVYTWAPGSSHTLRAPFQGDDRTRYYFGSWSDGGAEIHDIKVSADTTVYIANFVRQGKITSSVTPAGSGTVTLTPASPDGFYNDRSNIEITATPAAGFKFVEWSVRPNRSLSPKFHTVSSPADIGATFSRGVITTVTSDPVGRTVLVDGVSASTPYKLVWNPGSQHTIDVDTTQPDFVHYNFTGWADGGGQRRTVTAGSTDQTYTAKFTTQQRLTVSYNNRNGTVTSEPASADGFYDEGTTVQLSAAPASGLVFGGWTGDLGGLSSPISLTMNDQKLVNAGFVATLQSTFTVNGASTVQGAVAPGEIIVIYGSGLGPDSLVRAPSSGGKLATTAGGTQVLFDGKPAPLIYASSGQVSAIVPYSVKGTTVVAVNYNGQTTRGVIYPVVDSRPAIFTADATGRGIAAALNEDGTPNSAANPARRGQIVALYVTGEGTTNPAGVDGQFANAVYPKPVLPVSVRIGGLSAPVHYAGAAPGLVAGLMQVNVQIPDGVKTGPSVPIQLVIGPNPSHSGVTIAVQ